MEKGKEMKKGIIFDVDGTLWDACAIVAESWNLYLEKYEKDVEVRLTEQDLRRVMGMTMSGIADTLFGILPKERRMKVTGGCFAFEVEYLKDKGGILYPDLKETLRSLSQEYHLYIVSNCQVGYIEDFIQGSGLGDIIEDFESFGNTGQEKSCNIRLLAERNHLDQAVYVGDTLGDYHSTREAGLPFIHARYGFGKVEESVPYINGLKELPEMVRKILA